MRVWLVTSQEPSTSYGKMNFESSLSVKGRIHAAYIVFFVSNFGDFCCFWCRFDEKKRGGDGILGSSQVPGVGFGAKVVLVVDESRKVFLVVLFVDIVDHQVNLIVLLVQVKNDQQRKMEKTCLFFGFLYFWEIFLIFFWLYV